MSIDLNILNHLGLNLYSNVPAVLSEAVANAWDADAEKVEIDLEYKKEIITIKDDGHGMTAEDINDKFLNIGYARREKGQIISEKLGRNVMGRKGIGKLSLFSIAEVIEIYSTRNGQTNGLRLDSNEIQDLIKNQGVNEYYPKEISVDSLNVDFRGTKIILSKIKKRLTHEKTKNNLRKRLARRFSIIGSSNKFSVIVNGNPIEVEDRDYYHKIQYLWYYGDESKQYVELCKNATEKEKRNNQVKNGSRVTGWLGMVEKIGQLSDGTENLNKIVLLMRGKMCKEDMIEEFREGGLYIKYLFGEITADFLDDSEKPDIATTGRQSIVEEDPRYIALKDFLQSELKYLERRRNEFKQKEGEKEALKNKSIRKWYETLSPDVRNKAKSLFGKINQIIVNDKHKKQLYSYGIMAFHNFLYKESLDELDKIPTQNLDDILKLFPKLDNIESTLYYKITKNRVDILKKFETKIKEENALEKIVQNILFDHLWLLDPSWDRATQPVYMEEQVSKQFQKINAELTDEEEKGRVDLRYKTLSGKHVIIELKRASVTTSVHELLIQVEKYRDALIKLLSASEGVNTNTVEVICIVGKELKGWENSSKMDEDIKMMAVKNIRVITYDVLLKNAYNSYDEYLRASKKNEELIKLIKSIETEI